MNIYVAKKGRGFPLVLFHGWGSDQRIWDAVSSNLQDKFTFYTVDLPGFGQSSLMDWESFKINLLGQLPFCFAVGGWSLGGFFATRLALEAPDRVTHLLNIASTPKFVSTEEWPGVHEKVLDGFYQNLQANPQKTLEDFIGLQVKNFVLPAVSLSCGLQAGLGILSKWDLRNELTGLQMPVCYMFGRLDKIIPQTTLHILQKLHPHFNYVLFERAGHVPFLTHQDKFIYELEQFLL